jgi:hypothetical protein
LARTRSFFFREVFFEINFCREVCMRFGPIFGYFSWSVAPFPDDGPRSALLREKKKFRHRPLPFLCFSSPATAAEGRSPPTSGDPSVSSYLILRRRPRTRRPQKRPRRAAPAFPSLPSAPTPPPSCIL